MPPHTEQRALKRKRTTASTEDDLSVKVARKLHHGLKEVRKVAKKAKSFETQKMVKKLKLLRKDKAKNEKEIKELETRLETLKHTNHDRIGILALQSKLKKDKVLSSNPSVTSAVATELPMEPSTASHTDVTVDSRLLSSKALASEVNSFIASLRLVINPQSKADIEPESPRPAKIRKRDHSVEDDAVEEEEKEGVAPVKADDESDDEDRDVTEADGWESGTVDGGSLHGGEDGEEEPSDDEDAQDSDPPREKPKLSSKAAPTTSAKERPKPTESAFLPSLSVGFTRGDSDSEFSDSEARPTERKNRRGQRARRAIWEKKYGRGAKHLNKDSQATASKPNVSALERASGSPAKGRPNNDGGYRQRDDAPRNYKSAPSSRAFNGALPRQRSEHPPPPPAREDRPLHPSWEAKRKLKEKESGAIVAPQNKRITFDD